MNPTLHKILTDWAVRVPDGSPDPANSYHMVLLERSMDGMGLPRRFKQGLLKRLRRGITSKLWLRWRGEGNPKTAMIWD